MRSTNLFFWLLFILPTFFYGQIKTNISIQNTAALDRKGSIVSIKWEAVLSRYPEIDTTKFIIINSKTKKQIPFQLEHCGSKTIQNLLVQVDVKANSTLSLYIQKGNPETIAVKTYCRFVPERKDDFAWENDQIAFRTYGKAIEKTKEDAYGIDVWVKRTDKMILNERYKLGDYHLDHGNGMDYYHVGFSLGAGNMAPYIKDTIRYSANYHQWQILDNGPLRSTFRLIYDPWDAGGIKIKATKTISIDAGSQLNRIENSYLFEDSKPLPVVVGIIKRSDNGILSLNEQQGIMGYWEPTDPKNGTTGVGSILTTPVSNMQVGKSQILAVTFVKNNEAIVYYTGAAWDKAGKITNGKQWFSYLDNFYQQIKEPLIVSVQ
jgi:hypothetical protein